MTNQIKEKIIWHNQKMSMLEAMVQEVNKRNEKKAINKNIIKKAQKVLFVDGKKFIF